MPGLISLLIALLILSLIVWFVFWILDQLPFPPTPKIIIKCIVGLIVVLYLLGLLVGYTPPPTHFYYYRP